MLKVKETIYIVPGIGALKYTCISFIVTAFQMPTMKTVYDILHGHKKDYSQILNVRFKSLQASAYKQSEQELLMVFLIFRKLQKNVIQWNDLVEFLYSCKYYDTIEEVFAYLKSKGSSCDKTLKNIMKG